MTDPREQVAVTPDVGRSSLWKVFGVTALIAIVVLAHGIGNAADDAGAVDLGFISPVRSAEGLADAAAANLSRDDVAGARKLARAAVRRLPVKQSVVRTFAEVESADIGGEGWSDTAISAAGKLGWRDSLTQAQLLIVRAEAGDVEGSINHIDAVLRRSDVSEQLFAAIGRSAYDDAIRPALVARLASSPPWRAALIGAVSDFGDEQSTAGFARLLIDLDGRQDGPLPRSEIDPVLSKLAALGMDDELIRTASVLDPLADPGRLLNDPEFVSLAAADANLENGPFDWKRGRAQRTIVTRSDETGDADISAVNVRSRSRVPGVIMFQNLRLPVGAYRFSYQRRDADRDLKWQILCGDKSLAIESPDVASLTEADDWQLAGFNFSVPADCPVQRLQLQTGRNLAGEAVEGAFAEPRLIKR